MKKSNNTHAFAFITIVCLTGAQAQPWNITGNTVGATDYFGANSGSSNHLKIRVYDPQNIRFETHANRFTTPQSRMVILGNTGITDGYVGIGLGFTPSHKLDVDSGDINVNLPTRGYKIGAGSTSPYVLWHNGDVSNIYVGVGAGNAASTGTSNTYVGQNAGNSNTGGSANTFIGESAGLVNTSGQLNVFVGESAGNDNTTGFQNVFIGSLAGEGITTGRDNTFIGEAARSNTANSFNRTAIGAFAQSDADNTVILGSVAGVNGAANNVNVGVGTTVPAYPLHVNGTVAASQFLVLDKTETKDLLALITDLRAEVAELKKQMLVSLKN